MTNVDGRPGQVRSWVDVAHKATRWANCMRHGARRADEPGWPRRAWHQQQCLSGMQHLNAALDILDSIPGLYPSQESASSSPVTG